MVIFTKKPTSIDEQIAQLKTRGMAIPDDSAAKRFLDYCSYYRFCGYALHFENLTPTGERTHHYKPGTSFSDVERIYHFDSKLRRILFHYTSLIEIDFRANLGNETAWHFDNSHWYLNSGYFRCGKEHEDFIYKCTEETNRSREVFITAYKKTYDSPLLPPIWMLIEILPFATWSRLYQNLSDRNLQDSIAKKQGIPRVYLISWLQAITVLRNACAHHSRIWNRNFTQAPLLSKRIKSRIIPAYHQKIVVLFWVIYVLLTKLNRENYFIHELIGLTTDYPRVPLKNMGISSSINELVDNVFLSMP